MFQSSPGPRAGCNSPSSRTTRTWTSPFQSSPGPRAGCNPEMPEGMRDGITAFQSSPGPRAGCNSCTTGKPWLPRLVSILTRPESRVQLESAHVDDTRLYVFQSSPGPRAGCNLWGVVPSEIRVYEFQSSPGPRAGCNTTASSTRCSTSSRFNPHPAREPGATTVGQGWRGVLLSFQSSPGPRAGCNGHGRNPVAKNDSWNQLRGVPKTNLDSSLMQVRK